MYRFYPEPKLLYHLIFIAAVYMFIWDSSGLSGFLPPLKTMHADGLIMLKHECVYSGLQWTRVSFRVCSHLIPSAPGIASGSTTTRTWKIGYRMNKECMLSILYRISRRLSAQAIIYLKTDITTKLTVTTFNTHNVSELILLHAEMF